MQAGIYIVTRALNIPLSDGGEIIYFTLQALGIIIEDLSLWIFEVDCRNRESSRSWRRAGYITTASFYIFTRSKSKAVPLAAAHGIRDERGELFAAVELVRRGVVAVPGNFVAAAKEMVLDYEALVRALKKGAPGVRVERCFHASGAQT